MRWWDETHWFMRWWDETLIYETTIKIKRCILKVSVRKWIPNWKEFTIKFVQIALWGMAFNLPKNNKKKCKFFQPNYEYLYQMGL